LSFGSVFKLQTHNQEERLLKRRIRYVVVLDLFILFLVILQHDALHQQQMVIEYWAFLSMRQPNRVRNSTLEDTTGEYVKKKIN